MLFLKWVCQVFSNFELCVKGDFIYTENNPAETHFCIFKILFFDKMSLSSWTCIKLVIFFSHGFSPINRPGNKYILHSHWHWFYKSSVVCSALSTYVFILPFGNLLLWAIFFFMNCFNRRQFGYGILPRKEGLFSSFSSRPEVLECPASYCALVCCGCDTSYIVSVHIQCQVSIHIPFVVSRAFMAGAASQAGDADSSRVPGLTSGLQGSVNAHRGALLLVPQWQCISYFVFYNLYYYTGWHSDDRCFS